MITVSLNNFILLIDSRYVVDRRVHLQSVIKVTFLLGAFTRFTPLTRLRVSTTSSREILRRVTTRVTLGIQTALLLFVVFV